MKKNEIKKIIKIACSFVVLNAFCLSVLLLFYAFLQIMLNLFVIGEAQDFIYAIYFIACLFIFAFVNALFLKKITVDLGFQW